MCSDDDDNMICNDDAFIVVLSVCGRGPQEHCCARVNIDIHNTDCNMLQCDMLKWNRLRTMISTQFQKLSMTSLIVRR